MEVWKSVEEFAGKYEVSNLGNVRNAKTGTVFKQRKDRDGYPVVSIGVRTNRKRRYVHRLVALAFIPNPNGYPQVNHKDENKENNSVENLEWCTCLYNVRYGTGIQRSHAHKRYRMDIGYKYARPIRQYDLQGNLIAVYLSSRLAEQATGVKSSGIRSCTCGHTKTAGGYVWIADERDRITR